MTPIRSRLPLYEERANALSHALAAAVAIVALSWMMAAVDVQQHPLRAVALALFLGTMTLTYLSSAAFHAAPDGRTRALLRRLDHATIFLFIAGSFTPFVLEACWHRGGRALILGVWGFALLGTLLKLTNRLRGAVRSTLLYVLYGWMLGWLGRPWLEGVPEEAVVGLVAGGLIYTAGSLFYLAGPRMPYAHFVWHIFVLAGSAQHLLAVHSIVSGPARLMLPMA